jgi:Flp pilus assembly protein TadG
MSMNKRVIHDHRRKKFFCDDGGGAMVEFAIATGVFVTLLMGIVEFGYAAWARNSVASDAREGARYAIVHGSESGRIADSAMVADYVKSRTSLGNSIVVVPTWAKADKSPGSRITVKVKHVVSRAGSFLGAHTDSSSSTMIIIY